MSLYQRIIAPVDLNSNPLNQTGLRAAVALAQDQNATLKIITVVDEAIMGLGGEFGWTDPATFEARMRDEAKTQLEQAARSIHNQTIQDQSTNGRGIQTEVEVIEAPDGHIAQHIEAAAMAWRADLIVVGTQGHHGLARWLAGLTGSTSENLLHMTRLPLLIVPDQDTNAPGEHHALVNNGHDR